MASKYCPGCGRIVTINSIPNYFPWGCGSLENQPILKDFKTYQEKIEIINEAKREFEKRQQEQPKEEIGGGRYQMKLFQF